MISYYILLSYIFPREFSNFFEKTRGNSFLHLSTRKQNVFVASMSIFCQNIHNISFINNIFTFVPCRKLIFLKSNKGRQNSTSFFLNFFLRFSWNFYFSKFFHKKILIFLEIILKFSWKISPLKSGHYTHEKVTLNCV